MNQPAVIAPPVRGAIKVPIEKSILDSKILIADDEPMCCRLLAGILRRSQFDNVQFAHGGHSTLEQIRSFQPDLVLLDMQMPDLSGQEVCRQIRADPELVDLPVLAQTATVDRKEMGILFEAGVSDFLSKPINPSELVSRVTVHLERQSLLRELRGYRERTSMELEAARRMQFDLLPAQPVQRELAAAAGMRIGSYSRSSSEIGGDLWGLLPINASSFGVFLADFAGHGVTAALNTFRLHALIHEHPALHHDPAGFLAMLNDRLKAVLSPGQFATFLYVVVDSSTDRIRFASAGAPPPIATLGLDGPAVLADVSGLPLGVVRGAKYGLHERPFDAGSMLVLFSDGLSEFPDARGMRIGDEGLRRVIGACHPDLTPHQVIDRLCEAAGVGENSALPDDTTIVCIDRRIGSASLAYRNCLNGQESLPLLSSRHLIDASAAAEVAMPQDLIGQPLLDLCQIALLRDALGEEDLRTMLSEFSSTARQALCGIGTALASNDLAEVRRQAHAFKGAAASFGASRLAAIAVEFELEAPSIASILQRMPALADAIDETLATLPDVEPAPPAGAKV